MEKKEKAQGNTSRWSMTIHLILMVNCTCKTSNTSFMQHGYRTPASGGPRSSPHHLQSYIHPPSNGAYQWEPESDSSNLVLEEVSLNWCDLPIKSYITLSDSRVLRGHTKPLLVLTMMSLLMLSGQRHETRSHQLKALFSGSTSNQQASQLLATLYSMNRTEMSSHEQGKTRLKTHFYT